MVSISQNPFQWKNITVHAKEPSRLQRTFTDKESRNEYNVMVRKDASLVTQLGAWTASPKINVQHFGTAHCELIVQSNDQQVGYTNTKWLLLLFYYCSGQMPSITVNRPLFAKDLNKCLIVLSASAQN